MTPDVCPQGLICHREAVSDAPGNQGAVFANRSRKVMASGRVIEQRGLTQDVLFDKSNGKPAEKKSMAQLDVQYLLERNCLH